MAAKVCVFCGSSDQAAEPHLETAEKLGRLLAENHIEIVYGGGSTGSMGRLATGALKQGGKVAVVMPQFMVDLEQAHTGLSSLVVTHTMAERKARFLQLADTVIALPGGIGTFEEIIETVSLKKLRQFSGPIFLLNSGGYYDPLIALLTHSLSHGFISSHDMKLWQTVESAEQLIAQLT